MDQSFEEMKSFIGQQVRVVLDYEDDTAVAEGQMLACEDGGEIVVLDDMGFKHYCWPMLKVMPRVCPAVNWRNIGTIQTHAGQVDVAVPRWVLPGVHYIVVHRETNGE